MGAHRRWLIPLVAGVCACPGCRGPHEPVRKTYAELVPDGVPLAKVTRDEWRLAMDAVMARLKGVEHAEVAILPDRLRVGLPVTTDRERLLGLCTARVELAFVLMPANLAPVDSPPQRWRDKRTGRELGGTEALKLGRVVFRGQDLRAGCVVQPSSVDGQPAAEPQIVPLEPYKRLAAAQREKLPSAPAAFAVRFEIVWPRKKAFAEFSRTSVGRHVAIVLDGKALIAPSIRDEIPGLGAIEGSFAATQAMELRDAMNSGAMPFPLRVAR